jgi:predicted MFS family arabinose efflux permease
MGLLVLSQVARWQAHTPTILLVAQILGGAAQGVATVNAWALVADAAEADRRGQGQSFGILNASLALGLVAGYLFAGALGSLVGWQLMSLMLAALPLLVLPALAWIPRRTRHSIAVRPGLGAVLRSVVDPRRLALTAMAALTLAAGQGALYLLPFGVQQRDLGPFAAAVLRGWLGDCRAARRPTQRPARLATCHPEPPGDRYLWMCRAGLELR